MLLEWNLQSNELERAVNDPLDQIPVGSVLVKFNDPPRKQPGNVN